MTLSAAAEGPSSLKGSTGGLDTLHLRQPRPQSRHPWDPTSHQRVLWAAASVFPKQVLGFCDMSTVQSPQKAKLNAPPLPAPTSCLNGMFFKVSSQAPRGPGLLLCSRRTLFMLQESQRDCKNNHPLPLGSVSSSRLKRTPSLDSPMKFLMIFLFCFVFQQFLYVTLGVLELAL